MVNFWDRLKKGLSKTSARIEDVFRFTCLDESVLNQIEETLIMADVGVQTAADIRKRLSKSSAKSPEEAKRIIASELVGKMQKVESPLIVDANHKPFVVLMIGVNGGGKTTTIGKIASFFKQKGYQVSMGAVDTFRMAAIEQLQAWGKKINCPVYAKEIGADPAGVAYDALTGARKRGDDILFLDTAGRLQNKNELMAQLQKIIRVLKKIDESAPHAILLTLDACVGQNALSQVSVFKEMTNVTGLVMTKLDGTAKGGILIPLAEKFSLPIYWIGIGESIEDLQTFSASAYVNNLLGINNE